MRQLIALLGTVALVGCGALEEPSGPEVETAEAPEPLDDEGPGANLPEGIRLPMASCPNGGNVKPATPYFTKSIDGYASYVGQSTCSGTAKPGVVAFQGLILKTYPCTSSGGIVRGCSVGGQSEHKEGRAWDWMINYPHPAADAMLGWLLATDAHGNKHAMARRVGIMYMIWNRKMWRAYAPEKGWQAYTGSNPHTDHVHISFSWNGANKKTSFWSPPPPPPPPAPTPEPVAKPDSTPRLDGGAAPEPDLELLPLTPPVPRAAPAEEAAGCSLGTGAPDGGGLTLLVLALLVAMSRRRRLASLRRGY